MRMLNRVFVLSLSLLLTSVLAPSVARAQAPQYPPQQQPGYPQPQPSTPGYPQQQAYPQPGYPQQEQAPGYPQQQTYPQPGYPQQQAYPQPGYPQQQAPGYPQGGAPPAAYYAPPPAYPPPPVTEPQYEASARPAARRGLVFLPYIGFQSVVGSGSSGYSTGFHMGGLLGGHIGPFFSINGELTLDVMNPDTGSSGIDVTQVFVDLTLSPLFHFGVPYVEFVVGPKLGMFFYGASETYPSSYGYYNSSGDYTGYGLAYGFTAGAFFPLGRIALGALLNFTGRSPSEICFTPSGGSEECNDSPSGSDLKEITFSFALLL
jgi:hypothetical protein